ncbi:MAG: hypothetical protein ABI366_02955 [Ginsengibacter sp.]
MFRRRQNLIGVEVNFKNTENKDFKDLLVHCNSYVYTQLDLLEQSLQVATYL